jgi:hypothetical protein
MQWIMLGLAILLSAAFSIAHAEKNAFNVTCLDGITLPQGTLQTTGQGSVTAQPDQGKVLVGTPALRFSMRRFVYAFAITPPPPTY